jgi:ferredoxin-NADP reductase
MSGENDRKADGDTADDVSFETENDADRGGRDAAEVVKKLKEKLAVCEKERQEYLDGWQRAKADLVNARKRDEEERREFVKFANEQLVGELLPVLESFEMAMLTGPLGRFVLNVNPEVPAVLLAGGIGITPLHSVIKHAAINKVKKPITLIYSNSSASDIPFKADLDKFTQLNQHLSIHYTVTSDPNWQGLKRRINADLIKELVPKYKEVEFYVCGPATMVLELKKILVDLGVTPQNLKSELFTGY